MIDRLSIKTKSILINSGVCVAAFAAIMALYYRFPVWYVYLISEDTPAEYATTTAYLAGCCMMAWAMIRNRDARTMINVLLLLFMFFVGMEEISWGQRIIGIETTDFFMEHNHQREFNLHNLSFVKYTKMLFHNGVLVWLLLSWIPWRKLGILGRLLEWLKVPKIPPFTAPYFILALVFAYFGIIPKSEEFNELIFAYGFAFLSLDIYYDTGPAADRDRLHILPAWLLTGAVVASALFLSVRWPWPDVLSSRMNLFAVKEYPRRGLDVQAEKVFEYLVATPQLRTRIRCTITRPFSVKGERRSARKSLYPRRSRRKRSGSPAGRRPAPPITGWPTSTPRSPGAPRNGARLRGRSSCIPPRSGGSRKA